jgi:hypothetical protein
MAREMRVEVRPARSESAGAREGMTFGAAGVDEDPRAAEAVAPRVGVDRTRVRRLARLEVHEDA